MKILIIDAEGLGLDFALRCAAADHEVRWAMTNKGSGKTGHGFRGITMVPDWRSSMGWARDGLIITTGNAKYMRDLDRFRDLGFKIFGPTERSAALEIDRALGMAEMAKVGIEVPPYHEFKSLKEAESFARKSDKAYAFKTLGSEEDKALSYVASDPADMVAWLQRQQKLGMKLKGPCMLQEKIDMLAEVGVSGWFGPEGFLPEKWQICFEHKKLMAGENGPNCFTPDAEVLTKTGWKPWPDVTMDDEICTLKDGRIIYDNPSQIVVGDFDGYMVGWLSPMLDILVTPGHQMYVQDDHYRKPFFFEDASKTYRHRRTVARSGGAWQGEAHNDTTSAGAALLGAYIADGHCREKSIVFGNCPPHKQAIFSEIIRAAGYTPKLYGQDLYVNSKHLVDTMAPLGNALFKSVPKSIKDAPVSVIKAFLRGYAAGDGTMREGNLAITTISKLLADDVQELCLKVGWAASIAPRDRVGESHEIDGVECVNRHVSYEIRVSQKRPKAEISEDNRYRERYVGKVYCCTVPSHVIYVRRNGKPCWIGQTGEQGTVTQYVETDKMAHDMLKPMENYLLKAGHRGDFAIGCGIDKSGKAWPFEFTARLGWPAFYIQITSHRGDPAQWMRDLLDGEDTLRVSRDVGIGVVCAQPRYPYNDSDPKMVEGVPISGCEEVWADLHPAEMMMGRGPKMDDGKVVDGPVCQTAGEYVLIMTALGDTVEKARSRVYRSIDQVSFPNMMFRNDIGLKLEKSLPKLHDFGYAEEIEFS